MSHHQDDEATQAEKIDEAAEKAQEVAEILDEVRGEIASSGEQGGGQTDTAESSSGHLPGNGSKQSPI